MPTTNHNSNGRRVSEASLSSLEGAFQSLLPVLFGERREKADEAAALGEVCAGLTKSAGVFFRGTRLGNVYCNADDAAAEWFVRIRDARDAYDRRRPFHAYAYTVLKYICIDLIRRANVRKSTALPAFAKDTWPSPDELAERSEERKRLKRALRELKQQGRMSRQQRVAVACKYYRDMRSREAGARLGVTAGEVDMLTLHARRLLREELRESA